MSFEWFVARRYLTARRKQAFISLITAVSVLGVGVGVMAVIVALALMTGVQGELRDRILGSEAHVYVYRVGGAFDDLNQEIQRLRGFDGVVGAAPAIRGEALLSVPGGVAPVLLKGIDPAREAEITDIGDAVKAGSLAALLNRPEESLDGIVLGAGLAQKLGGLKIGDPVTVLSTAGTLTAAGMMPKRRPFTVVALVQFGFESTDANQAFVSLESAAAMLGREGPDIIQLKLADRDRSAAIRDQMQDALGPSYFVQDWTELNRSLYSALWLEKVAISFTIGLIIMVAALNIIASLVLMVMEKNRDIAILRTMGAPARAIRRIFMMQGLAIGLVGTTAGTILGIVVARIADHYQIIKLPSDVYQITYLPFRLQPLDVLIVFLSATMICFVATIYPARQASRIDPAEALRNQ
ncbi:MAG TPA: FtsX-like permease family protein [Vicinamibacterales bacterium]|nr:FtsX-like permease family protein [Vicinamibacterales bacterium]